MTSFKGNVQNKQTHKDEKEMSGFLELEMGQAFERLW